MPRGARTAQVAFARLRLRETGADQPSLFPLDRREALLSSLLPGTRNTRYGRTWRMGQFKQEDGFLTGRIGFDVGSAVERWSEALQDFEATEMIAGRTAPFAVDLGTLRIAFQLRPGVIKATTFTENFRALLEAASVYRWAVEPEATAQTWDDWLSTIMRITELRTTLLRPNPSYKFEDIEQLIEGAHAYSLSLIAKAGKDDAEGLKVDEGWLADAINHARDYGDFSAKGQKRDGGTVEWKEKVEGRPKKVITDVDPLTSEVRSERLTLELRENGQDDNGKS